MKLRLTSDAQADLKAIRAYSRRKFGEAQTVRYMAQLREGLKTLRRHPELGYCIDEIRNGFCCLTVSHHRVFYSLDIAVIPVVAILHESQLPKRHLAWRGEK